MEKRIAVVQFEVVVGEKKKNLEKAVGFIEKAAQKGAHAVCFPDYFLTDCPTTDDIGKLDKVAERVPDGESTSEFVNAAKKNNIYVVPGSIVEMGEDGKLYSTCTFIGPDGKVLGKIRKSAPENAPAKHEIGCGITAADPEYRVFETELGKVGIMLDMEGAVFEVPRILQIKGAELIFWPVNFSARFHVGIMAKTRVYSGQTFGGVASACRVGWRFNVPVHKEAFFDRDRVDLMYAGGSIIAFDGNDLAHVPDYSEGIATADMDTSQVRVTAEWEKRVMPLLRRPETYGDILRPVP